MVLAIVMADRGRFMVIFCSSDVLYLQKTDLYLGLTTTWCIFAHLCMCVCVDGSSTDLSDCQRLGFR